MDTTIKAKVTEIFTRYKFSNEDAAFISGVLNEIDNRQHQTFNANRELFLTQKDKFELIHRIQSVEKSVVKTIHTAGLIQFCHYGIHIGHHEFYAEMIQINCGVQSRSYG